jgi:hypothetical protein
MPKRRVKLAPRGEHSGALDIVKSKLPSPLYLIRDVASLVGRPRKHDTPEGLLEDANAHFLACGERGEALTLYGTVHALGYADPQALENVKEFGREYSLVVNYIRAYVAAGYERDLRSKHVIGSIFALKNLAGWTDRQDIQYQGVVAGLDLSRFNDEQLARVRSGENIAQVLSEGPKLLPPAQVPLAEVTPIPDASAGLDTVKGKSRGKPSKQTAHTSLPNVPSLPDKQRTTGKVDNVKRKSGRRKAKRKA